MKIEQSNMINLLDPEVIEKFGSHPKYILFVCNDPGCSHSWGVNLNPETGKIRTDQMLCQSCSVRKLANSL